MHKTHRAWSIRRKFLQGRFMGRIINLLTVFVNIIHVKLADQHSLFFGLSGRWRVPENAVCAAFRDVRFKLVSSVTFDPGEACAPLYSLPESGCIRDPHPTP